VRPPRNPSYLIALGAGSVWSITCQISLNHLSRRAHLLLESGIVTLRVPFRSMPDQSVFVGSGQPRKVVTVAYTGPFDSSPGIACAITDHD
jgi:hypothetical protein